MKFVGSRHDLVVLALFLLALSPFSQTAFAQQVTYYDFDGPQSNSNQTSRQCSSTAAPSSALFCFNDGTGAALTPSFLSDTYPANIDPVQTDNPPVQSTHTAIQLTSSQQTQASSMWFSVPQKISSGFTSYFAFKITPNANSYATADGIAFVIQNSAGGGSASSCSAVGAGLSVVGGNGGCMGYGGIDNSLAIELDTYRNPWDPDDNNGSNNDNHVAVQNCGAGLPNSPDHNGSCLVNLNVNNAVQAAINSQLGVTLADGNVHEVVVIYSGPNEAVPNLLQIYIDPPFVPETHTPTAAAVPVLSGTYNITANLNLMNSDSAYVGFTSATGAAFEQHELLAWTYTPHTTVVQGQPLSPPGQPTVFPFGSHVYAVTYPAAGPSTDGINMIVTANTITPLLFSQLVSGGPFAGSQCQVYDETGGNCIVYSVSCVNSATNAFTQCPATDPGADPILVKSAYNNSIQPVSPGYLQGDPFYNLVSSISGNGTTATVTCAGECSVTAGQTVTVAGSQPGNFNGTITALTADPSVPNVFTFASTATGTATGGYLTSNNLQNIFSSYSPQRIDATTTGKTHNFSDFVVTSVTTAPTALKIQAPAATYGTTVPVTVTATSTNGTPTGNVMLSVDGGSPLTQPLSGGTAIFNLTGLTAGVHQLSVTYPTTGVFLGNTATATITINAPTPIATLSATSLNFGTLYLGDVQVKSVTLTNTGTATMTVNEPFIFDVGNGNSKEFIALSLCPRSLAVGKSCTIYIAFFAGPSYNLQTAILKIMDNAPDAPQSVNLSATVINPQASFKPNALNFGTQRVGTTSHASVMLTNTGATPLAISNISMKGANAGDFSQTSNCPAPLAAGASCTLSVSFTPARTGARTAYLNVVDNARSGSQQVFLYGTGK